MISVRGQRETKKNMHLILKVELRKNTVRAKKLAEVKNETAAEIPKIKLTVGRT